MMEQVITRVIIVMVAKINIKIQRNLFCLLQAKTPH